MVEVAPQAAKTGTMRMNAINFRFWILDFGPFDFGFWILDFGLGTKEIILVSILSVVIRFSLIVRDVIMKPPEYCCYSQ